MKAQRDILVLRMAQRCPQKDSGSALQDLEEVPQRVESLTGTASCERIADCASVSEHVDLADGRQVAEPSRGGHVMDDGTSITRTYLLSWTRGFLSDMCVIRPMSC